MIQFFLPMREVPTITQQMHAIRVVKGRPVVYDPPELKAARQKFTELLSLKLHSIDPYALIFPLDGPLRLTTKWIWYSDQHGDGTWKVTKPDTDNLIKLFKDCMTRTHWWHDDAQVCSEITEKFWGAKPGIYVKIEVL